MRTNGLLASFEKLVSSFNPTKDIEQFIRDNYKVDGRLYISKEPNENGKYEVSCRNAEVVNKNITSLTNGMFEWKIIGLDFNCHGCHSLTSLEGTPKEVHGSFYCYRCTSLTSLEGGPWWVNGDFNCAKCDSLETLEGAPKYVGMYFYCNDCNSLTSLKGAPEEVGENFGCSWCHSLTSLKGAPEKIGGDFICIGCYSLTSLEGVTEKIGMNYVFTGSGPIKASKNIPANIIESVARYTAVERTE